MIMKKNEELAEEICADLKDYGKEFEILDNDIVSIELLIQARKESISVDDATKEFNEYTNRIISRRKEIEEKIKPTTDKIKAMLYGFTQEMLCCLLSKSRNKYLNELIVERIKINDCNLNILNTIEYESGRIFETVAAMSDEDIKRFLSLRESNDSVSFDDNILVVLNEKTKRILFSKLNKGNVDEEKRMYCIEMGIENESDFQMRKKKIETEFGFQMRKMGTINAGIMNSAQDAQDSLNGLLDIDDDSIVKDGLSHISGIRFKF